MRWQFRISTWLLLLVLVPTIPLLGFLVYFEIGYAHERRAAIESTLVNEAERFASDFRDRIARSSGYASSLAVSNSAQQEDIPALYAYAQRIQTEDTGIAALTLIDREERMLFLSMRPFGETYSIGAIESVRAVFRSNMPDLSGPFLAPISNRKVIALSVPVRVGGATKYVLRAIIGTDVLSQTLAGSALPAGWVAAVVDSSGTVVARSHLPEVFVGKSAPQQVKDLMASQNFGIFTGTTLEGVTTRSVLRPIGNLGWYVVIGVPLDALTEPLRAELIRTLLLGGSLLLLCVVTALLLSKKIIRGVREPLKAAHRVGEGTSVPAVHTGILELNQMSLSLLSVDQYSRDLESLVAARTRELMEARQRAEDFAADLEKSVEAERQRISREVHDQIGSVFTGIKLMLSSLPSRGLTSTQTQTLDSAIDAGLETARRISSELRPPVLDDLGLTSALRQMLEERLRGLGISTEVDLSEEECLTDRQTIGVYRIVQEACTNVIRHADATLFSIQGHRGLDGVYQIVLTDNGTGFPREGLREGGLGVAGMKERAKLLGGDLHLASGRAGGAIIQLTLPVPTDSAHQTHENTAA